MEEPFGDSSMIPTFHVSRMARQHVTVALSGDGGDELFAGYDRYVVNLKRGRFEVIPSWAGRLYRNHVYPRLPSEVKGRKLAWNITLPSRDRYLDGVSFLPALNRERSLFSDEFVERARGYADPFVQFQRYYDEAPAHDQLSRLLYLDTKTYLPADIMTKVDRMSMATSLEMRAPLLDHVFVEWVTSLPVKYKFRDGTRKFMLKKLAEHLSIPSAVLHRPKQGFALPLVHWMRGELRNGLRGRRDHSGVLWLLLVLELWHRNFLEAQPRRCASEIKLPASVVSDGQSPQSFASGERTS
jgi:asparagine synthase (glutamine-hydrolysing)